MIELLRTRRSIRKFTNQKIEPGLVEILKEALLRSPSSRGINPWRFVFVDDPVLLKKLAAAKPQGGEFIAGAALAVVICADERNSDVWIEDCSIAAIIAQLAAHSLGLGSCWVQIRNRPHDKEQTAERFLQELLSMPEHIKVECIMGIGYPGEKPDAVPDSRLQRERICLNKFA
jgi:nitroreductase